MGLKTQYADDIMTMLQDARDVGLNHVVLMPSVVELKPVHFSFFETKEDAISYLASKVPNYLSPDPAKEPLLWYRDTDTILHE